MTSSTAINPILTWDNRTDLIIAGHTHYHAVAPAELIKGNDRLSYVTIYEGKYHQVKRMFHSIENEVLELKRVKIANLELDETLNSGEYRFLNEQDFENLKK